MINLIQISRFDFSGETDYISESYSAHDEVVKRVTKVLERAVAEGMAFKDGPLDDGIVPFAGDDDAPKT